ncbi:YTH domain-containing protein ECT1-like [Brassica napus]|uniref:YTH domain-containing protein ECT1-like n=1 Tax=Brassica napus TaxID=3708 RepID=UPI00207879DF|nr:YTH domain-containing protein ECT1-like [Brassica napus]
MATERNAMDSERGTVTDSDSTPKRHNEVFEILLGELQTVTTAADSTPKKHDESPPTDDTSRMVTGSTTSSVTVSACADNGTGVVSSQPNKNGQAYATDFLKASHRDKNNSSYNNYQDSNLHGDRAVRSYCWSQTSVSSPGNLNVYGQLPSFTQSHAFRPTFKGKQASGQFTKHANQKTSSVPYSGYYGNGNTNSGFKDHRDGHRKPERNGESDSLVEMKCGPRTSAKTHPPPSDSSSSSLKQNSSFVLDLRREMFNLPDFQTDYEDATFFVIKSYSEDDVHKSIKYSVWSSTVNGNKKLDAAYRDAEAKTLVDGKKRPIFLFFSVNASRQFVGLAEMVGYVDMNKDLDFWQVDKWCGFFPVEWHVVKDVPNWELCHIVLHNNEGKAVTHTRDTQEIKLREGLQMLSIFKKFSAVTSLLDDMDFYEEREKSLRLKKEHKPATLRMDLFKEKDYDYENGGNRRRMNQDRGYNWSRTQQSLVNQTKNLSIRGGYSVSKNNTRNPR